MDIIAVSCRFVPYDQWFVTHLDSSWKIKQVKHWLLAKCDSLQVQDPPRFRPISPITFASTSRSKTSFDLTPPDYSSYEDDDEYLDGDDDDAVHFTAPDYTRRSSHQFAHAPRNSISNVDHKSQSDSEYRSADNTSLFAQFVLIAFSTGQVLEDDYALSWYKLRPYELLELHRSGSIMSLPKHLTIDYVQPYFEAKVRTLHVIWKDRTEMPRKNGEAVLNEAAGPSAVLSRPPPKSPKDLADSTPSKSKSRRTKLEWRERWLIIHKGILNLCKDRLDTTPSHHYPLSTLSAIRGTDHLAKKVSSINPASRIICARFKCIPVPKPKKKPKPSVASAPSSPTERKGSDWRLMDYPQTLGRVDGRHIDIANRSGFLNEEENEDKGDGEWIVMDMLDDNGYTNILRVLHRFCPDPISSSFLPSSMLSYGTTDNDTPTPTPSPPYSYPALSAVPYPEWRIDTVNRAQRAGLGEVSRAMDWVRWGVESSQWTNTYHRHSLTHTGDRASIGSSDGMLLSDSYGDMDDDVSEVEWENWMHDLDRQEQATRAHHDDSAAASPHREVYGHLAFSRSPMSSADSLQRQMQAFSFSSVTGSPSSGDTHAASQTNSGSGEADLASLAHSRSPLRRDDVSFITRPASGRTVTTSIVSVGTPDKSKSKGRPRSSTVTAGLLRKNKEKGKDRDGDREKGKDKGKGKEKQTLSEPQEGSAQKPKPSLTLSPGSYPDTFQVQRQSGKPRRLSVLRHVRSGSSLGGTSSRLKHAEDESETAAASVEGEKGKKKLGRGLVRGMSVRAERLVRGFDSALDFVDGR